MVREPTQRRSLKEPNSAWHVNRLLFLLAGGAAVTAVVGVSLALVLPLCDTGGGSGVSCLRDSGVQAILHTAPPAVASVIALLMIRWRLARIVAAGLLWFWAFFFVGALAFYVLPALLQTGSAFIPNRDDAGLVE